jgi:hypothetical protein
MKTGLNFRLFVSSTFSDFTAEREALQKVVFPELADYCQKHGATFQAIDLRWGITEEAQQEHDTLRICLEEVRRCQALSPRPNFAVLMGDRYGWEPVPARISVDHWDRLLATTTASDGETIRAEYEGPDLNAIPPVMQLLKRGSDWSSCGQRDAELLAALRRAAESAGFTTSERLPYFASATHQEIALGALDAQDEKGNALNPEEHVNVYVRRIEGLPTDASAGAFIDWDAQHQVPVRGARQRLAALESQLRTRLPGKVCEVKGRWGGDGTDRSHIDALCAQFLADQKAIIDRELANQYRVPEDLVRNAQHHSFSIERARNFAGRETLLQRISFYLEQPVDHSPLIVHGSGGIGKSALMARAYLNTIENLPDEAVKLVRFIGGVPGSESLTTLLTGLAADIASAYGFPVPLIPKDMKAACQAFRQAVGPSTCDLLPGPTAQRPLIIFLDALDQLDPSEEVELIEWLPKELGEYTRVVVSMRGGPALLSVQRCFPKTLLAVSAMTPAEGRQMLDAWLSDTREANYNAGIAPASGRRLTNQQRNQVLKSFELSGNPLWLKLAYEEARTWPSWVIPRDLPETVEAMVEDLIAHRLFEGENHPRVFLTRALAYLTAGRFGLAEEELSHALATDPDVKAEFEAQNAKTLQKWELDPELPRLPHILWSRLYFDLQPYLATAQVDNTTVYRWFHREFHSSLYKQLLGSDQDRHAIHGHLADTHRALDAASRPDESGDDRLYAHTNPDRNQSPKAARRIMEQPWQLARAIGKYETEFSPSSRIRNPKLERLLKQRRYELMALLSDFGFCQAKAHRIDDLIRDWSESSLIGRKSRQWQQFLRTRASILRQRTSKTGWPINRIFLQLALEDDPESAVTLSANSWIDKCQPKWTVSKAPLAQPKRLSIQILPPGIDSACDVYLDSNGRIVLEQFDGSGRIYEAQGGRFLENVNKVERPMDSLSEDRPNSFGPGVFWPLGEGRWFRWQGSRDGGGPDGTASLFDSQSDCLTTLPQAHHEEVWAVLPLSDGRYASLGLNSTKGLLVIWSLENPTELLRLNSGPLHEKPAGILELGDRSLVIWPAFSDGSGMWLKPIGHSGAEIGSNTPKRTRLWSAVRLDDTTSGINKAIRVDDAHFLTLSCTGEVRIWFIEFLERAGRSRDQQILLTPRTFPNRPSLNLSRRISRTNSGDDWDTKTLEPAEMDMDAKLLAPRDWEDWFSRAMRDETRQFHPRLWPAATVTRLPTPDPLDLNLEVWGRWLYHYLLEDHQRSIPHFTDSERFSLIEEALKILAQITPDAPNIAILQTQVCRRDADLWRDGSTKSPLTALIERKFHDENLMLAWIAFCESESVVWAIAQCAEMARLLPANWSLLLRWAQIIEHCDPNASRELRSQALNRLGISAAVRSISDVKGYDLWEIYLNGRWSVWACERPSPDIFAIDGQRLVLTGAPRDGIRYLTLDHE